MTPRQRRIRRLQEQGLSRQAILDRLNGRRGFADLSARDLKTIGFSDRRIQNILARQRAGLATGTGALGRPGRAGSQPATPFNPAGGIVGTDEATGQSAYDMFDRVLLGLGVAAGPGIRAVIEQAVIDGIGPDQIDLIAPELQKTPEWKLRFPGWDKRVSNGFNQLSVSRYLELEDAYHEILSSSGLPAGFYDDPSDFGDWIAKNISPDEIRERVNIAMDTVRQVDPTARDLLTKFYGVTSGDLAAYFLDSKRALPALERQYKAANVASWAARNGLKIAAASHYEDLIDKGITAEMAAQGYSTVAAFNQAFGRIGNTYGETYNQEDAERDVFFNDSEKRRRLLAREASTFSGSSRGSTGSADRGTSY